MLDPFVILSPLLLLPVVGLLRFVGCGTLLAISDDPAPGPATLTVTPNTVDLGPGAKQTFQALDASGSAMPGVSWTAKVGKVGSDGIYTAPDPFVPGSTTTDVTATLGGVSGSARVNLKHVISVTVSPASVTLTPGTPQNFTGAVLGSPDLAVDWIPNGISTGINTAQYKAPVPFVPGSPAVTITGSSHADPSVSGIATVTLISGNTATFVSSDTATKGNWQGLYGSAGYALAGKPTNLVTTPPAPYLPSLILAGLPLATSFGDPTADVRGLQKPPAFATRFADMWSVDPGILTLDLQFNDYAPHTVAIYCVDWDTTLRKQTIEILDPSQVPPVVLDSHTLSAFNAGQYLIWKLSGHVILRITKTGSGSAVLSGIFFQ